MTSPAAAPLGALALTLLFLVGCAPGAAPAPEPEPDPASADAGGFDAHGAVTFDDAGEDERAPDAGVPEDDVDAGEATVPDGGTMPHDAGESSGGWRSSLYPADWTPAFSDEDGRFLHDFSYAGYARGERAIPDVEAPFFDVSDVDLSGGSDAAPAIQAAIDAASLAGGGVVRLPAGDLRLDSRLVVTASGVVVRGAGRDVTRLFFSVTPTTDTAGIAFRGAPVEGPDVLLLEDAPARASSVRVADPSAFVIGDDVDVGFVVTDAFVAEHGMTGTWQVANGQWRSFFRRSVVAIDGDRLTLDVPLRAPLLLRDAASVRRVSGLLHEVGLEDVSLSDAVDDASADAADRQHVVAFVAVKDAWLRRVSSFHSPLAEGDGQLASGGVIIERSKRVTIDDVTFAKAQNRGDGGNGYLFEIMRSSEVLIKDSTGRAGRHNFVQNWDFSTNGCVFLRVVSEDGRTEAFFPTTGLSEFHHSLAMANLIDSASSNDGWGAVNRGSWSSGAGHSATENVFWNTHGGVLRSMQYGWGYVIGTDDVSLETSLNDVLGRAAGTAPEDFVEGRDQGATLTPSSLYEDQLARRLQTNDGG